jgi:hypothetical protein
MTGTVYATSLSLDGGFARALLAAALLASAYALASYWRSLSNRRRSVRYTLVSLRALALLLMACALAGLRVEYESEAHSRVLLLRSGNAGEAGNGKTEGTNRQQDGAVEKALAATLRTKGFEVVEAHAAPRSGVVGGFIAGVLLTDGAMSAEEAEREVDEASRATGDAPVFVVTDSGPGVGPSVALESVKVLGRAVRGVPISVRCTIHARGMRNRESLLTVADDAKTQASAKLLWTQDDERQSATLSLVPKVSGWIDYRAKVEAANDEDATRRERPFTVYTEERRLRVLFFESEPTWEAKFIRRSLEQSGLFEVDYSAQVSRAAAVGMSEEASEQKGEDANERAPEGEPGAKKKSARADTPLATLRSALRSAANLNAYDCVIVGATENSLLSAAESARLRDWVLRRGGGLIVLGGNSFNGSIAAAGGKLYSLLPAETAAPQLASGNQEVSRGRPLEALKARGVFTLTPTEAGAGGALGGYLSAGQEAGSKAEMLTGQGLRLGELRPGAITLAVAGRAGPDGTSETGAPLIAAMRYGAGHTLLFAPADSWRIRTAASSDEESAGVAFNALWQGLVLWTAAGAGDTPASVVLSDDAPAVGSIVTAELRARDGSYAPLKIEKLSARLQPLTEDAGEGSGRVVAERELNFVPDVTDKSVWRARFPLRASGRFALEIDYAAGGVRGSVEKYFAAVPASPPEAGAALDTLRRASRERDGGLLDASGIDALLERLAATPSSTESVRHAWELRTFWPLAFFIPLLLSIEWLLRRWWKED